jgi:hypothetical protein
MKFGPYGGASTDDADTFYVQPSTPGCLAFAKFSMDKSLKNPTLLGLQAAWVSEHMQAFVAAVPI